MASNTWSNLLSEVRLVCRVLDSNGNEKVREEFTGELFRRDYLLDGAMPLVQFAPFEDGTYTITVTVTHGTAALGGVPQRIIGRYMLCGLEMMPAFIFMVTGVAALIIAALVAGITIMAVRRRERC